MAYKNVVKDFEIGATFHAYNRGVEKRQIFYDNQDYAVFMSLLKRYLDPTIQKSNDLSRNDLYEDGFLTNKKINQLHDEVDLHAFCLMPNHYHLLLTQKTLSGMTKLVRRVASGYSVYFNKRYDRSGTLYQGTYMASRIKSERRFEKMMSYLHYKNPMDLGVQPEKYEYSSLNHYLERKTFAWISSKPQKASSQTKLEA